MALGFLVLFNPVKVLLCYLGSSAFYRPRLILFVYICCWCRGLPSLNWWFVGKVIFDFCFFSRSWRILSLLSSRYLRFLWYITPPLLSSNLISGYGHYTFTIGMFPFPVAAKLTLLVFRQLRGLWFYYRSALPKWSSILMSKLGISPLSRTYVYVFVSTILFYFDDFFFMIFICW